METHALILLNLIYQMLQPWGDDEDGVQTIKWIHLNLQFFAIIDYPLVTRINGLWSLSSTLKIVSSSSMARA
jgi:hypothetical protein